jgi:nucleoside recognition membrane protein YjiH
VVSKFFNFVGWAIIVLGAIISFITWGGIMSETTLPPIIAVIPFLYSIFGGMIFFAIGNALNFLQRTAETTEKIYSEMIRQNKGNE